MGLNKETTTCLNCGIVKRMHSSSRGKYCSTQCQNDFQKKQRIEAWRSGKYNPDNRSIRTLLQYLGHTECSVCGIREWQGKHITLEVEHKDGNSSNNCMDNVCFICPNCHSQTSTYKGANRGNGRHYRRVRYKEGKSY